MAASSAHSACHIRLTRDKVEANFDKGVLKVKLLKRPEAIGRQRTIPIKKG